jgi:hypothetical protein
MELLKNTIDTFLTQDRKIDKGEFMKVAASEDKDNKIGFEPKNSKVIKVFTFNGQAVKEKDLIIRDKAEQHVHNLPNEVEGEEGNYKIQENQKIQEINFDNLEIMFKVMNVMAGEGEIRWKYDYDAIIDKNATYILRINIKAFFGKLLKKSRELGFETSFQEDRAFDFARTIKHKKYCLGSFNTRFLRQDNSERKFISNSAVFIDIAMLQNMGIEIGEMVVDNRMQS